MTLLEDAEYQRLVQGLGESGDLAEGWRGAFLRTPRSLFVPDTIWIEEGGSGYRAARRQGQPGEWWAKVNSDDVVVTQLDDGATGGPGLATSSVSMPSLVARMLGHLDARAGHRVLEVGTGSGWSTALLCARVGDGQVTSVEIDGAVAHRAALALDRVGLRPRLLVGDGELGSARHAPYDRISSTAAVARVPYAWVEQCRPGGVIVTPWGTPLCNAGLLKLRVNEDGTAEGPFVDSVNFMWVRGQRPPLTGPGAGGVAGGVAGGAARASVSAVQPQHVFESVHAAFAIGLRVPGVRYHEEWSGGDPQGTWRLVLCDGEGSRAVVRVDGGVRQSGARDLWEEVVAARQWWDGAGQPQLTAFRVRVGPEGQEVRLSPPSR
ncbi:hypothetical protein ACWGIB_20085 [Streptomyces xiamenensis]